ncbi:hypothetical protein [Nostoc sp.]|uniref:hypothetical protein n=1 Tax=Nostoc sp. TaxID=1180 RepID=UPI002FF7C7AE
MKVECVGDAIGGKLRIITTRRVKEAMSTTGYAYARVQDQETRKQLLEDAIAYNLSLS